MYSFILIREVNTPVWTSLVVVLNTTECSVVGGVVEFTKTNESTFVAAEPECTSTNSAV